MGRVTGKVALISARYVTGQQLRVDRRWLPEDQAVVGRVVEV